jgi:hypothetical protein
MLQAGRGRHEALQELSAAEYLGSQLADSHALASRVTGWMLATQARAGRPGEARACLAALDDERANSGEAGNARAVICLADGDAAGALAAVADVLDGTAPVIGYVRSLRLICWPGSPTVSSVISGRRTRRPNARSASPSRTGWSCRGSSQPSAVSTTFGVREGGDRRDRVGGGGGVDVGGSDQRGVGLLAGSQGADFVGEARVGGSAG